MMLRRLLLALTLSTALIAPARAEPITTALFGAAFAASLGGAVVSAALSIGGGLAVSWVASLFRSDQPAEAATAADPREVRYGERVACSGIVGIAALGGHLVHYNEYANATKAQLVYILADQWCDDLVAVKVGGVRKALIAKTVSGTEHKRYWVTDYNDLIDIRFHDGRPGQAADTELVAQTAGWNSAYKYSGHCYAAVTVTSNRDKFNGSLPELEFVVKGGRWYDRRKDSTAGGSGAHRFADPTTWEYSANPIVAADHLARGYYFNGERVLGGQMPVSELDAASIVAAMNVSDQTVTKPDASTRPRYEAHFVFDDSMAPIDLVMKLCACAGGKPANMGGQLGMFAGAAQSVVATLTDDDFVVDEAIRFSPHQAGQTRYSGIQGTYTRADDDAAAPYAAIHSDTFATNDGRSRYLSASFPEVRDPHQAWCLAKQKLYGSRLDATMQGTLDIKDLLLQVGDWVAYESTHPLRGNHTWRVAGSELDFEAARMRLTFEEISSAVYADTATEADIEEPARAPGVFGYLTTASNVTCDGVTLPGSDGTVLPALGFAYDGIADAAVSAVLFQYRIKSGPGPIYADRDDSPGDGAFYTSKGVGPAQLYEFRHKLDTLPGRTIDWSEWADAGSMTPSFEVVVGEDMLPVYLQDALTYANAMVRSLQEQLAAMDNTAASSASWNREQVVKQGENLAAVIRQTEAILGENYATASDLTLVEARVDDIDAAALLSATATVDEGAGEVLIMWHAQVTSGGTPISAGIGVGVAGGVAYAFVESDKFVITNDGGATVAAFFQDGTTYLDMAFIKNADITGAKIANLAVTDAKIAAATITGAKIANLTVGTINIADAAVTSLYQVVIDTETDYSMSSEPAAGHLLGSFVVPSSYYATTMVAHLDVTVAYQNPPGSFGGFNDHILKISVVRDGKEVVLAQQLLSVNMNDTTHYKFNVSWTGLLGLPGNYTCRVRYEIGVVDGDSWFTVHDMIFGAMVPKK